MSVVFLLKNREKLSNQEKWKKFSQKTWDREWLLRKDEEKSVVSNWQIRKNTKNDKNNREAKNYTIN